eukprot:g26082.t1
MGSGSSAQKYHLTTAQVQETAAVLDQEERQKILAAIAKLEVQQAKKAPQLVSNSGVESSTGWRVAATVNEMEAAELEDFVVNLSKSTCRALQKAIGARLEAEAPGVVGSVN